MCDHRFPFHFASDFMVRVIVWIEVQLKFLVLRFLSEQNFLFLAFVSIQVFDFDGLMLYHVTKDIFINLLKYLSNFAGFFVLFNFLSLEGFDSLSLSQFEVILIFLF